MDLEYKGEYYIKDQKVWVWSNSGYKLVCTFYFDYSGTKRALFMSGASKRDISNILDYF